MTPTEAFCLASVQVGSSGALNIREVHFAAVSHALPCILMVATAATRIVIIVLIFVLIVVILVFVLVLIIVVFLRAVVVHVFVFVDTAEVPFLLLADLVKLVEVQPTQQVLQIRGVL